jgi:hypothetical protein
MGVWDVPIPSVIFAISNDPVICFIPKMELYFDFDQILSKKCKSRNCQLKGYGRSTQINPRMKTVGIAITLTVNNGKHGGSHQNLFKSMLLVMP